MERSDPKKKTKRSKRISFRIKNYKGLSIRATSIKASKVLGLKCFEQKRAHNETGHKLPVDN